MAEIINDLRFEALIDPDKYTDIEQLNKDVMERNFRNAERLMSHREITGNRYREPFQDSRMEEYLVNTYEDTREKPAEIYNDRTDTEPAINVDSIKTAAIADDEENVKTTNKRSLAAYLEAKAETEPSAANELGVLYYLNDDLDLATHYFEKAVSMDYVEAQRNLAIILEQNNSSDYERIFSLYETAAQQNDAAALNNLGCLYLDGDGVEADVKKAVKCFEKAVSQKDTLAMINLADCYAIGNGVRINPVKAFKLYEEAAKTENPTALARLAECYEVGAGVKQSIDKALELYQAAVDKGNEDVAEKLEQLLRKRVGIRYDLGTTIDEDKKQAVEASERQAAAKNKNEPSL